MTYDDDLLAIDIHLHLFPICRVAEVLFRLSLVCRGWRLVLVFLVSASGMRMELLGCRVFIWWDVWTVVIATEIEGGRNVITPMGR